MCLYVGWGLEGDLKRVIMAMSTTWGNPAKNVKAEMLPDIW